MLGEMSILAYITGHITEISLTKGSIVYSQQCSYVWSTANKKVTFKASRVLLVNSANLRKPTQIRTRS